MESKKKKSAGVVVYLDPELHRKFKNIAQREGRTMTGVVRLMIEKLVATHELRQGTT